MSGEHAKQNAYPRVEDLYKGKSVLITGAAGFVGMVLLEILLRNVPDIEAIYILLREKKGVKPEERKEQLFRKEIFEQLKKDNPDVFFKVRLIKGDVSCPNLGICEEDMQEIIQNVSIVFHCAAIVSHVKPLKETLVTNVVGTHYIVELCKKLRKLEVLVYTSTICSNCNRHSKIEEEIYRLPFPAQKFLKEIENGTEESLQALISECHPHWPNSYTFSKCLAENILLDSVAEIPFAIIRPSLVFTTWKAPHPGFAEKNSAILLLSTGVAKGFVKVLLIDPELVIDVLPVDVVANAQIVSAWKVASGRTVSPFVVNCTSYGVLQHTWTNFGTAMFEMVKKNIMPNTFRTSNGFTLVKNATMFKVLSFYEHYLAAYFMDFLLKLSGKKPKLVNLYQLFDKVSMAASFFSLVNWTYATENFHGLDKHIDQQDKEKFYTDMTTLTLERIVDDMSKGFSEFNWEKDKRTKLERKKKADERYRLTVIIQYSFLAFVSLLLFLTFSQVFHPGFLI